MEIVPGYGIGDLLFGMTKSQVFAQIGFPDKSYLTDSGCREVQYFGLKLVLKFESDNADRLGWIEVHARDATIFGVSPWHMSKREILDLFTDALGEQPKLDEYQSFDSYSYNEKWVELQFELGDLHCINFGVLYGQDDHPLWPSKA